MSLPSTPLPIVAVPDWKIDPDVLLADVAGHFVTFVACLAEVLPHATLDDLSDLLRRFGALSVAIVGNVSPAEVFPDARYDVCSWRHFAVPVATAVTVMRNLVHGVGAIELELTARLGARADCIDLRRSCQRAWRGTRGPVYQTLETKCCRHQRHRVTVIFRDDERRKLSPPLQMHLVVGHQLRNELQEILLGHSGACYGITRRPIGVP